MKRALLASYEKDEHLLRLAKLLYGSGWTLMASVGTAKYVNSRSIPCRDISDMIGPPILRHRVVTLARKIYAALLATTKDDMAELDRIGVSPIDLVYVRLYPIQATVADPRSTVDDVIEKTDIGGPTILRAASKGRRLALCNPRQIDELEAWLQGGSKVAEREKLATRFTAEAERYVADHVDASARYWEKQAER